MPAPANAQNAKCGNKKLSSKPPSPSENKTHVGGTRACSTNASAPSAARSPSSIAAPLPNNASAVDTGLLSAAPAPSASAFEGSSARHLAHGFTPSPWPAGVALAPVGEAVAAAAAWPLSCLPPAVKCSRLPPPPPPPAGAAASPVPLGRLAVLFCPIYPV